jgi:hypothetical protein
MFTRFSTVGLVHILSRFPSTSLSIARPALHLSRILLAILDQKNNMSARSDSPILLSFERKISEKILQRIAEAPTPTQDQTLLYSPSIFTISSDRGNLYTFLRSPSIGSCSTISTDPEPSTPLLQQKFPSCLSISDLGSENEHKEEGDGYAESWHISSPRNGCSEEADIAELAVIYEKDFQYHPSPRQLKDSRWSSDSKHEGRIRARVSHR